MFHNCSDDFFRFGYPLTEEILLKNNINKKNILTSRIDGCYIVKIEKQIELYKIESIFKTNMIGEVELMISNINMRDYIKIVDFYNDKWKEYHYIKINRKKKLKKICQKFLS